MGVKKNTVEMESFTNQTFGLQFKARQFPDLGNFDIRRDGDSVLDSFNEFFYRPGHAVFGNLGRIRFNPNFNMLAASYLGHDDLIFVGKFGHFPDQVLDGRWENIDAGKLKHIIGTAQNAPIESQKSTAAFTGFFVKPDQIPDAEPQQRHTFGAQI